MLLSQPKIVAVSLRQFWLALRLFGAVVAMLAVACSNDGPTGPVVTDTDPDPTVISMKTFTYGPHKDNVADLRVPPGSGPFPVVVLIHGGYWREAYRRDLMDGLADDLSSRGYATWNIEYRRTGQGSGGGYPATFADVAAAIDHLEALAKGQSLDLSHVAVIGHSSGGHLAAWAAGRANLPGYTPGANPVVRPLVTVTLAGVLDLKAAVVLGLGGGAASELLGMTGAVDSALLELSSPIEMLPTSSSLVIVHGTSDFLVPKSQSVDYYTRALESRDRAELLFVEGADHFDVIDPNSHAWAEVIARLATLMPPVR